jgi:hypothetical protein
MVVLLLSVKVSSTVETVPLTNAGVLEAAPVGATVGRRAVMALAATVVGATVGAAIVVATALKQFLLTLSLN